MELRLECLWVHRLLVGESDIDPGALEHIDPHTRQISRQLLEISKEERSITLIYEAVKDMQLF